MKKWIGVACLATLLGLNVSYADDSAPAGRLRRYKIETAVITYTITGNKQGKEVMYFDQWGMREAKYSQVARPSIGIQRIMTLRDNFWIFTLDFDKKIGKKQKNTILENLIQKNAGPDLILNEQLVISMGGEKVGTESIAGKPCEVWYSERLGMTFWLWQGIPLKTVIHSGKTGIEIIAEKIEEGVEISEERFALPKDFFFTDGELDDILISFVPGRLVSV